MASLSKLIIFAGFYDNKITNSTIDLCFLQYLSFIAGGRSSGLNRTQINSTLIFEFISKSLKFNLIKTNSGEIFHEVRAKTHKASEVQLEDIISSMFLMNQSGYYGLHYQ